MELEIIIIKFSGILKMMSRNTFPEPQPHSALYDGGQRFNGFFKASLRIFKLHHRFKSHGYFTKRVHIAFW